MSHSFFRPRKFLTTGTLALSRLHRHKFSVTINIACWTEFPEGASDEKRGTHQNGSLSPEMVSSWTGGQPSGKAMCCFSLKIASWPDQAVRTCPDFWSSQIYVCKTPLSYKRAKK